MKIIYNRSIMLQNRFYVMAVTKLFAHLLSRRKNLLSRDLTRRQNLPADIEKSTEQIFLIFGFSDVF